MSTKMALFVGSVITAGTVLVAQSCLMWQSVDIRQYAIYLALAIIGSCLKARLPGVNGTYSLHFIFVLIGIAALGYSETILMACSGMLVQTLWKAQKRPTLAQVLFNVANVTISTAAAYALARLTKPVWPALAISASVYFVINTGLVAKVVSLEKLGSFIVIWREWLLSSFGFHAAGTALAALVVITVQAAGWPAALLFMPMAYLAGLYYRISAQQRARQLS